MAFKMLDFEEKDRLLDDAGPELLTKLDTSPMFMAELVKAEVMSYLESQDIKAQITPSDKNNKLLTYLYTASVLQFIRFCIVLQDKAKRSDIVKNILKLDIQQLRYQEQRESHQEPQSPPTKIMRLDLTSPKTAQNQEPALETTHYCSFILADKFDVGSSDVQSAEYVQFVTDKEDRIKTTLREHTQKNAEVHVLAVSERKQMLFVSIKCPCDLTDVQISQALISPNTDHSTNPLSIIDGTLHFRDEISASMACDVLQKSHIPDKYGRKINFDTQYVRLKMVTKEEMSTVERDEIEQPDKYQSRLQHSRTEHIADEEIMAPGDAKKFVVIRGRAGIGKTSLTHCIMWRWAHGELARHFKVIFLLNLRILVAITTQLTLPNLLSRFPVFKVGQHGTTLDTRWLRENARRIAFIFDGLDELSNFRELWNRSYSATELDKEEGALHWGMAILKRVQLETSTVIVTSRPFAALSCIKPSMMVEVMGLTRERVLEFVDRNVRPDRVTMVKQTLIKSPILMSVSAITFYCAALCQVLEDDIGVTDKLTTYTQITAFIIQNFMRHSVKKATRNKVLKEASSHISSLCLMAYAGLVKRRNGGVAQLVFDRDDYEQQNLQQEEVHKFGETGLFLQTEIAETKDSDDKQVLGEFVHLSIQEFLAMAGVLMQTKEEARQAIEMLSTTGQFNMSLLFLYGLLFDKGNETIEMVSQTIGANSQNIEELSALLKETIHYVSDELQVLQMVHESQSPEIARQVGQDRFKEEVIFDHTKLTVVDILAVIFLLKHSPSTTSIKLIRNDLDAICVKELALFLQENNTVKSLIFYDHSIDEECYQYLADMLKVNGTMTQLRINANGLTGTGVAALAAALEVNTCLTRLTITSDEVTDTGVAALAAALEVNTALTSLAINANGHTGTGVAALAAALEVNTCLTRLIMGGHRTDCKMTDTGAASLAAALRVNQTLLQLVIGINQMTDTGIRHLAEAIRSNTTLERLELTSTTVHEEGAAALDEALKVNTKVHILIRGSKEARRQLQHHSRITF